MDWDLRLLMNPNQNLDALKPYLSLLSRRGQSSAPYAVTIKHINQASSPPQNSLLSFPSLPMLGSYAVVASKESCSCELYGIQLKF